MKESYGEGLATHIGPESCVVTRESAGEALTGEVQAGLSSRENGFPVVWRAIRVPTLSCKAEGHTRRVDLARREGTRRGL
jgi:hypothetical protein